MPNKASKMWIWHASRLDGHLRIAVLGQRATDMKILCVFSVGSLWQDYKSHDSVRTYSRRLAEACAGEAQFKDLAGLAVQTLSWTVFPGTHDIVTTRCAYIDAHERNAS